MLGRGLLVGGRATAVAYRSSAATAAGGGTTISKPANIAVGDIVFIAQPDNGSTNQNISTSGGSTWTRSQVIGPTSSQFNLFWKLLDATDVANGWSITNALAHGAFAVAYKAADGFAPVAAAAKSTTSNTTGQSTLALTGFTKAGSNIGTISVVIDRNDAGATVTAPTGFTEDARADLGASPYRTVFARNADYLDGTTATWTNMSTVSFQLGWLIEVTR